MAPIAIDTRTSPQSRPVTPGTRPVTPGTRPVTPGTRPVTPGNRPVTPGTRPVTPGAYTYARPTTPSKASGRTTPSKPSGRTTPSKPSGRTTPARKPPVQHPTESSVTSPSNSDESFRGQAESNTSSETSVSRNTASPALKGRTLQRKTSNLKESLASQKAKEPWRPPSKHPEIPPPPPSHLPVQTLTDVFPQATIKHPQGPQRPPWKPVGPFPGLPILGVLAPTAKFQSKFEIRMRKCCGPNLRVIKQDPEEVYRGLRVVGVGCNGNVQRAHHQNNPRRVLALKRATLDDDTEYKKYILRELKIMNFRQSNLVNLKEVCLWGDQVWMGMELCTCSVFNVLCKVPRFEEGMAVFVVRECLTGLEYLHHMGYIHRDVKSENVLLGLNGEVKLADFGLSCPITPSPNARMGTSKWMAPEVILQQPYSNTIDIWSLGIMLIELVDRVPPHHGVADDDDIYDRILSEPTPVFQRGRASVWLFALLEYMLERDGNRRPNAKEVLMALDESVKHSELTCATSQDLSVALRRLDMR